MWSETFKRIMYNVNKISTNSVQKTSYELQANRKPSLYYMHIWGYLIETKMDNPHEKSLDLNIISGYFLDYLEGS